jgi:hypothetical protein
MAIGAWIMLAVGIGVLFGGLAYCLWVALRKKAEK